MAPEASFLAVTAWLWIALVRTEPDLRCLAVIAFLLISLEPIFDTAYAPPVPREEAR